MDEYISKTKFEELMRKKARSNFDLYYVDKAKHYYDKAIGYNTAADEVCVFPVADVHPVRYGQWIWDGNKEECICSECGKGNLKYSTVFCPDCGARNDGNIE